MVITEEEVTGKIDKLKAEKSQGPDGIIYINPKLLKECKNVLCDPLTLLFNKSMREEKLPSAWKRANITPIHKGGDKTEPSNYRPVSLTSVPCKIMESLVIDKVKEHLDKLNVPNDVQHGFVSGRSCLTNLLISLEDWTKAVDDQLLSNKLFKKLSQKLVEFANMKLTKDGMNKSSQNADNSMYEITKKMTG